MRLINADKLHPDCLTTKGTLAISQSQIANAPTVDAIVNTIEVRPQGKWKITRLQNNFDDVYCPFCNARPTRSEYGYYLLDKFCHDCGARLEGYIGDENK